MKDCVENMQQQEAEAAKKTNEKGTAIKLTKQLIDFPTTLRITFTQKRFNPEIAEKSQFKNFASYTISTRKKETQLPSLVMEESDRKSKNIEKTCQKSTKIESSH